MPRIIGPTRQWLNDSHDRMTRGGFSVQKKTKTWYCLSLACQGGGRASEGLVTNGARKK